MVEVVFDALLEVVAHEDQRGEALDDGEHVVELVGHPAEELVVELASGGALEVEARGEGEF